MEASRPTTEKSSDVHLRRFSAVDQAKRDEQRLAELGYKQELSRTFHISFTIISVSRRTSRRSGSPGSMEAAAVVSIGWAVC